MMKWTERRTFEIHFDGLSNTVAATWKARKWGFCTLKLPAGIIMFTGAATISHLEYRILGSLGKLVLLQEVGGPHIRLAVYGGDHSAEEGTERAERHDRRRGENTCKVWK